MHLVGFIIWIYHDARSPERQILFLDFPWNCAWILHVLQQCVVYPIILKYITPISGEEWNLWSSSLSDFRQPPVQMFSSVPWCSFPATNHVSHLNKTTDKVPALCILVFRALGRKQDVKWFWTKQKQQFPEFNIEIAGQPTWTTVRTQRRLTRKSHTTTRFSTKLSTLMHRIVVLYNADKLCSLWGMKLSLHVL